MSAVPAIGDGSTEAAVANIGVKAPSTKDVFLAAQAGKLSNSATDLALKAVRG